MSHSQLCVSRVVGKRVFWTISKSYGNRLGNNNWKINRKLRIVLVHTLLTRATNKSKKIVLVRKESNSKRKTNEQFHTRKWMRFVCFVMMNVNMNEMRNYALLLCSTTSYFVIYLLLYIHIRFCLQFLLCCGCACIRVKFMFTVY